MRIKRREWKDLNARVAALETALGLPATQEEKKREQELAKQWAALWNYSGQEEVCR